MATAQAGGRHAGYLDNVAGYSARSIGRATRSLGRHAARHEGYLKNPVSKVPNWAKMSARQQQTQIEDWQGEIRTALEQIEILKRIP